MPHRTFMSLAALCGLLVLAACVANPTLPAPTAIPTAPGPAATLDPRLREIAGPIASGNAGDANRGRALFQTTCVACHGNEGEGLTAPSLTTSAFVAGASDQELFDTIAGGRIAKGMPAWSSSAGGLYSEDQIFDLMAYVREINQ